MSIALFDIILFCSLLASLSCFVKGPTGHNATSRAGLGTKCLEESSNGVANQCSAWDDQLYTLGKMHLHPVLNILKLWMTRLIAFFGTRRLEPRRLLARSFAKRQVRQTERCKGIRQQNFGGFGSTTLLSSMELQKFNEGSDGVQLPGRSLGHPRRQSGELSRRGKPSAPRSKLRATPKRTGQH